MVVGIERQKILWEEMALGVYKIGVIVNYKAYAHQLTQYIEELNEYSSVDCVGIVLDDEMREHQAWFEKNFINMPFLCCSRKECEQLTMLDAIIIHESELTIYDYIPSSIIKIGLPHGTDVTIESTLCRFGGGFYFDYILSARKQPNVKLDKYINSFPAVMRLNRQPFVCQLPFGFPKLDKFFNVVTKNKNPKKTIIYHISLLSAEEDWVSEILFDTLKTLLSEFPNYKLVFRVHLLNCDDPRVVKCINMGRCYPNFYYSDAESYIEDYADGAVMVTHREYYNHLFDLATGCPTVLYDKDDNYLMHHAHDERYFLANNENFIKVLNQALSTNFDTSVESRKKRCLAAGIYNPGASLDYLVNNLKHIVNDHMLPEWTPYYLNEGSLEEVDFKLRQLILTRCPYPSLFMPAYGAMTNYSALSLLLLADSFIKYRHMKEHFHPVGLKYFYQLLHHNDFNLLAFEAEYWWVEKGVSSLEFVFDTIDSGEISATPELLWLRDCYQISAESEDKINNFVFDGLKIINLHDCSNIISNDIILYGASVFAERIIIWNKSVNMFNPIVIIDGDESKQNSLFCGIPILPPSELNKYHQDIIIVSQGSLPEIVDFLILNNVKNKLFAFIDEPINFLLLNLTLKANESSSILANSQHLSNS